MRGKMADYLAHLDDIERIERVIRRTPIIRDKSNPFEMYDDEGFLYRYRFTKQGAMDILQSLEGRLANVQVKVSSVPPLLQLLLTLQFFGSGTFLRNEGDIFGLHISTVSRIIRDCSRAIASLSGQFIYFPNAREALKIQEEFYTIAGLPGIVGAVDCTHVPILSPGNNNHAELFRNRKGFFSINVQGIGDNNLLIRNLVVRWPGSTHDTRIFDSSEICAQFENREVNGILLGDNGYPLRE